MTDDRAFGDLLRFWRGAFELSQEELAERAGMSVRHLSFLENGHTKPSPAAIENLIKSIGLKGREAAALYLAAGHSLPIEKHQATPTRGNIPDIWEMILRGSEPVPASIMNPFGDILAVNRPWAYLHQRVFGDAIRKDKLNSLELFLDPSGWRKFISDWADIASVLLVIMQQEAIISNNAAALDNIARWAKTPGLPGNWPVIGASLSQDSTDYSFGITIDTDPAAQIRIVHTALGYFPSDRNKTYILQSVYLQGNDIRQWIEDGLKSDSEIVHPLCPYT